MENKVRKSRQKSDKSLKNSNSTELLMLTAPGIIWFVIFAYLPMFGLILAFKDFKYSAGIFASPWVGLKNFEFFFKSSDAVRIISNTIGYNLLFLFFNLFLAVCIALILDNVGNKKMVKIGQTSLLLPYFISWVVVGYIAITLFDFENGTLNNILNTFNLDPVSWYETPGPWRMILLFSNCWKTIGTTTLIFYGTLIGINTDIYEAAEIDGCIGLKRIIKITLPLLKPAIITMVILNIGNVMKADFGLFYYLPNNSGLLYPVTDVIDTYLYRVMRINGDISASSAVGFFQSVIGLLMVLFTNWMIKKLDPDNAMF